MGLDKEAARAAALAMEDTVLTEKYYTGDGKGTPSIVVDYLLLFVNAMKEINPDMKFVSNVVIEWAARYEKVTDTKMPQQFANALRIGHVLSKVHKDIGLQKVESYGNRQVYAIIKETGSEKS